MSSDPLPVCFLMRPHFFLPHTLPRGTSSLFCPPPLPVRCLPNTYLPDFSYFRKQISHRYLWEVCCPSCCNKTLNKSHLGGEGFALAYMLHLIIESSHNRSSQSLERGAKAKTIEKQGLLASFQPHGQVSFYYSPSPPYQG